MGTEQQLLVLRRKLETLGYSETLVEACAPLVGKLVGDLVNATEQFRLLKLQTARQSQELGGAASKVSQKVNFPEALFLILARPPSFSG